MREPTKFLKLLEKKYPSYMNKEVKFKDIDMTSGKLAATFRKATNHYHPDKKNLARKPKLASDKWGDDQDRQEFIRDEIIKIINMMMEDSKLFKTTDEAK